MTKPTWTMCHPNGKGTGSALRLELYPAHGAVKGSILATLAPQASVGSSVTNPGFDWTNAIRVKLTIVDLAHILRVLRGMEESIEDGKGLFHRSATASMLIKFEHRIEPVPGYLLDVSVKPYDGDVKHVWFHFRQAEALALVTVIEQSLASVAFGEPCVRVPGEKEMECIARSWHMGTRAHIQTKHVIKYGSSYFNSALQEAVYGWLREYGVKIYTTNDQGCYADEWEISKSDLEAIPDDAYEPMLEGTDVAVSADELRQFVKDLLDAPTGDPDYAWVSWF